MPQTIIIDVSQLKLYPKKGFNTFGIYCWHAYNTNPKLIEILISDNYTNNNNNCNFSSLGIFELEMRDGIQLFPIDYNVLDDTSIKNKIKAFKIIIKSTYGGNKTYINQIMFYENTAQEIKLENSNNESFKNNNNVFQNDINLPEDLSNSQISNEDKEKEKQEIQMQNEDNYKNTQNIKRNSNISYNSNKQYIVDYISETHSNYNTEMNENNNYNIEKNEAIRDDIKVEENNDIHDYSNNDNNEEENENNDEANKIIATSDELEYPYKNKYDRNISNNDNPLNQNQNKNLNMPNKNNIKSKKVQKLEKILKENILNNDYNKRDNNEIYINSSIPNQTEYNNNNKKDYIKHRTINNYPSLMQFKNDYIIKNNPNLNNISTRNTQGNNIQKYFKLNVQTPKLLTVKGYDNLLNKRRPYTPKLNEINRNSISSQYNINEFKNQTTMAGFNKINANNGNRDYETLEIQLQDMEQHLKNMALDNEISSKINYNSRTNREYNIKNLNNNNYFNDEIQINNNYIDKKTKNISMISNRSSFLVDQQKNINTNNSNINYNSPNNNRYKTEYKNNSINNINNEEEYGINKRIDDLEKNMLEIKDELNNISSNLKIFMNKDNFLYNFKDSIKQICYDFFTERINNNSSNSNNNHENINNNEFYNKEQLQNENNNEENENNSQYSDDYSENKIAQNEKIKIENEINQKIDEKLEYLCDNLQNQIFEKYLKPSINEIEKSMRENIEDIKEKVESINHTNITNNSYIKNKNNNLMDNEENINYNNDYDAYSIINKNNEQNSKGDIYHKTSSRIKKEKYEEINRLGEKLYNKLLEKEKKLKLLNQETNLLISKKHLGNNSFED